MYHRKFSHLLRPSLAVLGEKRLKENVRDFDDFVGAARELAAELPSLSNRKKYEIAVDVVWQRTLSRLVDDAKIVVISSRKISSGTSTSSGNKNKNKVSKTKSKKKNETQNDNVNNVTTTTTSETKNPISMQIADDITFLWKECGSPPLSSKNVLALTTDVDFTSPMLRMQTALGLLAYGINSNNNDNTNNNANNNNNDTVVTNRYHEIRQMLFTRLEQTRQECWNVAASSSSSSSQSASTPNQNIVPNIMDTVAVGAQVVKEGHRLPAKDRQALLEEVQHVLTSCVSPNGSSCFTLENLVGHKSILPFCLETITRGVRESNMQWSDRAISLVFSWVTAFKRSRKNQNSENNNNNNNNNSTNEADKLIGFTLFTAAKSGVPLTLLLKSSLLKEVSFFGLIQFLSYPILRPMAPLLSVDLLRELFTASLASVSASASSQTHNNNNTSSSNNTNNANSRAKLILALPYVTMYLPQIAPDVAGALARQCDVSMIPAVLIAIAERFKHLSPKSSSSSSSTSSSNLWIEINADVREDAANMLLADLIDQSMTTQAVQVLEAHSNHLGRFFGALFNFGISDTVLARMKILFERLTELRNNNQLTTTSASMTMDTPQLCRDLQQLADFSCVFDQDSNVRQGVHAERCCAAARILSDPTAAATVDSLCDTSEPSLAWSLFVSVHKLLANAALSSEIAHRVVTVIGVFFQDEQRLREAIGNNNAKEVLFLLECTFLSPTAKSQIAPAIMSIISENAMKVNEARALKIQQQQEAEEAEQQQKMKKKKKSSSSSKEKKKEKVMKEIRRSTSSSEKKQQEDNNDYYCSTAFWGKSMPAIVSAIIRNEFIKEMSSIPSELIPFSSSSNSSSSSTTTIIQSANEALEWLQHFQRCDTSNADIRNLAEPFVSYLRSHRSELTSEQYVKSFTAMDRLGLTDQEQILDEFSERSHGLRNNININSNNGDNNNLNSENNVDDNNNINTNNEERVNNDNNNKQKSAAVSETNQLQFVKTVAKSSSSILTLVRKQYYNEMNDNNNNDNSATLLSVESEGPSSLFGTTKLMYDVTSILQDLHRNVHRLSFNNAVELGGEVAAAFCSIGNRNDTKSSTSDNDNNNANSFSSLQQQQQELINESINQTSTTTPTATTRISIYPSKMLLVSIIKKVSVLAVANRSALTPSQAIALLQSLAVSGISQNSIFASLLAAVDNARKNAPLLEADVLALCSIVAELNTLSEEGKLSTAASIDLAGARSAAQDALAQFLRFLVRSKSLDHVQEFGKLLDAVVSVLATTIDVHTMQALGTSCLSRAHRGQLSASDVESILRIITNRISVAPHLAQQISHSVLPELRRHVAKQCFPTMSANAAANALYQLHRCAPFQHVAPEDVDVVIKSFEDRIRTIGKQLDADSIANLILVYQAIQRTSPVLQHVLTHLTTLNPNTVGAKAVRDISTSVVALRMPHRDSLAFLEKRLVAVIGKMDTNSVCKSLEVFAGNRSSELASAVERTFAGENGEFFLQRFNATQAASVAQSLAQLGVSCDHTSSSVVSKLLNLVYSQRRGSLFSNTTVVSNLIFVFETYSRDVHPELYDLIAPRRARNRL